MPDRVATTGPDLAGGESEGLRVSADGVAELASKSLLPNPDLKGFTASGDLVGWGRLIGPPAATGWNVYDEGAVSSGRQNAEPLPARRPSFTQEGVPDPLGVPAPENFGASTLPADAPRLAVPPFVTVVPAAEVGLPAAFYGVCLAWACYALDGPERRLGAASPRSAIRVSDGGSAVASLPGSAPDVAVGLAVLSTGPRETEALALSAPVYVQRVLPVGGTATLPPAYRLGGPLRDAEAHPGTNRTRVGAAGSYPAPEWRVRPHPAFSLTAGLEFQLSWIFRAAGRWSAPQGTTEWIPVPEDLDGAALAAWPPERPPGYEAWKLLWRGRGVGATGRWYLYEGYDEEIEDSGVFEPVYVFSADPEGVGVEEVLDALGLSMSEAEPSLLLDETGVGAPDFAPPVSLGPQAGAEAGRHEIRTTLSFDAAEGPPSPPAVANLLAGETYRVARPEVGNLLDNAEGEERRRDGKPRAVTLAPGVDVVEGVWSQPDRGSGAEVVLAFDPVAFFEGVALSGRFVLGATRRLGAVAVRLRQLDASGAVLNGRGTVLSALSESGETTREWSVGPGGEIAKLASAASVALVVECSAPPDAFGNPGARDLDWELAHPGVFGGLVPPRKRYPGPQGRCPATDAPSDAYPMGGYAVVVEDPPAAERHPELVGLAVNHIEYHAPPGTQKATRISDDLSVPVRGGESYALSAHVEAVAVSEGLDAYAVVFRDERGATLGSPEFLVSLPPGSHPWFRYARVYTAPEDAATLDVIGHAVGAGRVRLAPPVLEKGVDVTPFSLSSAASGYLIREFDLATPDDEDGDFETLSGAEGAISVSALTTPGEAGAVLSVATKDRKEDAYGPWATVGEAGEIPFARFVAVRVAVGEAP